MKKTLILYSLILFTFPNIIHSQDDNRLALEKVFKDWREFEKPPLLNGAPDYTIDTFNNRMPEFRKLRDRLNEIDKSKLDTESKVDWTLIWAEMNGFEFNFRVLKPWERDPAYYKSVWMNRSDVPAHEGPTHHMTP
jgi:alpha-N-acetylglucosamine transferase